MKVNRILFAKIKLQWEILKYGSIEVHIQEKLNRIIDDKEARDIFGNVSFNENDMIKERLISIQKKVPLLLQRESYEELARLKRVYESLLKRYRDNEQGNQRKT